MKGDVPRAYRTRGQGVVGHIAKKDDGEEYRIRALVRLDTRRLQCAGDPACLLAVARCYSRRGMVLTAKRIRREAGAG